MTSVFINQSSSFSAIGQQNELTTAAAIKANIIEVPVEEQQAHYYALPNTDLHKSFNLMMSLLCQQIDSLFAKTPLSVEQLNNTMLFVGSTSLDIDTVIPKPEQAIWLSQTDKISQALVKHYGFNTIHFTFNTACTSGANALLYATNFIKQGKIDQAVVIGCEFFNQLSVNGFGSLDLFSQSQVKPFAKSRDGLLLGEGVGAVLLSKFASANCQLEILGGYAACDDYSLTITEESGAHIVEVLNKAIENANVSQAEIDLVKVHGTASIKSDLAEKNALASMFEPIPPALAFKSLLGHTLGACGVIELALFDHCIQQNLLPSCDYQQASSEACELSFIDSVNILNQANIMLFNHFGFGGNNAALVIKCIKR